MRWLALGVISCVVCVASVAHASTGSQGPAPERDSLGPARKAEGTLLAKDRSKSGRQQVSSKLILAEPPAPPTTTSPTGESIKSLANGDSLVNPWFPGRGAVGVNVKVTW